MFGGSNEKKGYIEGFSSELVRWATTENKV
jgi:hypothetical protein